MDWKRTLKKLEAEKKWDEAIEFMKKTIDFEPNNLDAYLSMNYLLMNLLVEEDYNELKHDFYANLLKKYFDESFRKFSNNSEYLFFIGYIAGMSEWYFKLKKEDPERFIKQAYTQTPDDILFKWVYYNYIDKQKVGEMNKKEYAQIILEKDSPIKNKLIQKGSLGDCIYELMVVWAKNVLTTSGKYT